MYCALCAASCVLGTAAQVLSAAVSRQQKFATPGTFIGEIERHGAVYQAKVFRAGDQLIEINAINVEVKAHTQICDLLTRAHGEISITVQRRCSSKHAPFQGSNTDLGSLGIQSADGNIERTGTGSIFTKDQTPVKFVASAGGASRRVACRQVGHVSCVTAVWRPSLLSLLAAGGR